MDLLYLPYLDDTGSLDDSEMIVHCGCSKTFPVNPKYKLTYLNAKGSAEMSRMILAYAGIPFIDNRISITEWEAKKSGKCYFWRIIIFTFMIKFVIKMFYNLFESVVT